VLNDILVKRRREVGTTTTYQRTLGIDYGSVRVGLSLSDPLGLIAQPIEAFKNDALLFKNLKQVSARENVARIIVGMPYNLKGQKAQKAEEVQKFVERLKEELDMEILTWDERFTTTIANQTMLAMGTKKKERQKKDGRIDSMAAAVMLQGYLDSTKHSISL
jgi:putative Holliday junction resolvase